LGGSPPGEHEPAARSGSPAIGYQRIEAAAFALLCRMRDHPHAPLPKAGCDGTSRRMVGRYARNLICEQSVELHDPATAQALLAKVQPS